MYQHLDGSGWRNIWLVGDLHGCLAQLTAKLRLLRFDPYQDLLISVGDLIDRGPQSAACLGLLDCRWFRAVRGNHEQMAPLFARCRQLPLIIELCASSQTHIIAHADYPASSYRWQQPVDASQVLWNRQRLTDHLAGRHGAIGGADHFWFGHTPLKQRYDSDNQHYIDTGAVFGGELTLVQLQQAG